MYVIVMMLSSPSLLRSIGGLRECAIKLRQRCTGVDQKVGESVADYLEYICSPNFTPGKYTIIIFHVSFLANI